MKLSAEERDVLAALTLRGDITVKEIAKLVQLKEHRVRYIFDKMVASGCCYFYPTINPHRLGYLYCSLFVELQSGGATARQTLLDALTTNRATKTVGVLGGEYQFEVVVWLAGIQDLTSFFNAISSACPGIDYRIDFTLLGKAYFFSANFLEPRMQTSSLIAYGPTNEPPLLLDALDDDIINKLSTSPFTSARHLARAVGIPESTLTYRLNKLKEERVIICMGYMIDHLRVGLTLTTLLIKAKRPSHKLTERLLTFAQANGSIGFLAESFGAWDYQMGVLLYDQTKLSAVIDRLQESLGGQFTRICPVPNFESVSVKSTR